MYQLFIFFMITDPKTTVRSWRGQCLVASLVAVAEAGLRLSGVVDAPYYALFLVGPLANLVDLLLLSPRTAAASGRQPSLA
jgi:Na+-translocating ferredoxin:NAD+ oxidoreductase RnfD subunit